jgi:glutaredoxin-dependent peroxiredoxin
MAITVGSKAPDFNLKSKTADGLKDVKLSDNSGKKNTVLLFFPLAFTSVCTKEMCEVSAGINAYQGLNAEVYGVSVDSPFALEQWAQKENITIPLLSDLNKQASKAYGTLLDDLLGLGSVSTRAAFVVDKQGVVQYAEVLQDVRQLPNFDGVKAALQKCG